MHPNLGGPVVQNHKFSRYQGRLSISRHTDFIRGISARKLDSFQLNFLSESDERGSITNDYCF